MPSCIELTELVVELVDSAIQRIDLSMQCIEITIVLIDQILIVEPQETDALLVEKGQDLCTLVTCTPYGINTHRLLVRGHRVENAAEAKLVRVTSDAVQIEPILVAPVVAAPILLIRNKGKTGRKGTDALVV